MHTYIHIHTSSLSMIHMNNDGNKFISWIMLFVCMYYISISEDTVLFVVCLGTVKLFYYCNFLCVAN